MQYSICVIDDKIPASAAEHMRDTDLLNSSNLAYLIAKEQWTDEVVKNLIKTLLDEKEEDQVSHKWEVYGLTNPSLLINSLKDGLIRFDIIVYDWDYPGVGLGAGTNSEDILLQILKSTFCLIFIFSGADKQDEITAVLGKPEFKEFEKRLHFLDKTKNEEEQSNALITKAKELYDGNFSFRFAGRLRRMTMQVMDGVLSDLGRATLNELKNYLNMEDSGDKRDLVDFVAERFRSGLTTSELPNLDVPNQGQQGAAVDKELLKRIWSYRLYLPCESAIGDFDGMVRRGDIVEIESKHFMVVSADCDLARFWHKNLGLINVLPLNALEVSNSKLKEMLTICVNDDNLKQHRIKHLTGNIDGLPEGPFILPFLKLGSDYKNFVVVPKEIKTLSIPIPQIVKDMTLKERKNTPLKYASWTGTVKMCSLSEPFLTPVMQHIFSVLGGYGVPDYPSSMKELFDTMLNNFFSTTG
ncbi:MAG: hypothetical protein AB1746_00130 [Candidatus Zixiibacteriota bacterium]